MPNIRLMTALSLYFDRVYISNWHVKHINEPSIKEKLEIILPKHELSFLESSINFRNKFSSLDPDAIRFLDYPDENALLDLLKAIPLKVTENFKIFSEAFFLPLLSYAYAEGFYIGQEKQAEERGLSDVHIPLSFMEDNRLIPPFPKNDKILADFFASIIATQAIEISLPDLEAIGTESILWAKEKLSEQLLPFRMSMYRLSKELRSLLKNDATQKQILNEARFLVKTLIMPRVIDLRQRLVLEKRKFTRNVVIKALDTFKLIVRYVVSPDPIQLAKLSGDMATGLLSYEEYRDSIVKIQNESAISYLADLPKYLNSLKSVS